MSATYTYTFSLRDMISPAARRITGTSSETIGVLKRLGDQAKTLQNLAKDCGGSIGTLRAKLDLLKKEKELIPASNLKQIKQYNREIDGLTRQIDKLDRVGRGGGIKNALGAFGGFISPTMIGAAAVGAAVKSGMSYDENMAKVNITARLKGAEYQALKDRTRAIAAANKSDEVAAAAALEQIISQTGDADLSLSILDSTLKGAKSQFAGVDVVAGALAQTLSIVGKDKTNAQEVLDTFVAAKRVGAGEFKDFAAYMPGLIAGADALGIKYKEVAGTFAYMTGKGQRPDQANVLMGNLFTVLGRGEVRDKLSKSGVEVYDKAGNIRSLLDIFKDMRKVTAAMNSEQKNGFIERLGIVDKEAKNAFMVMSADVDKLANSLTEVANAAGETDRAMEFAKNSAMTATEVWNQFKAVGNQVGTAILPIISAGLEAIGGLLTVVTPLVGGVITACGWWFDALRDGSPAIWGLTAAGTAAGVMLTIHKFKLMEATTWSKATAFATGILTKAVGFLKAAFLTTPWGWVAVGVGLIAGAMAKLITQTDKSAKSYAAFRAELSKTQDEARGEFDAAMRSKEGSEQRAAAIKKINDQYHDYLPNVLSETASNNELAVALQIVNDKLEEKLRIKFRNMRIEAIENTKDEAKKELFDWVAERVAPEQLEEAMSDLSRGLIDMQDKKAEWWQVQDLFNRKYGVGDYEFTEAFKNVKGGGWNPFVTGGNGGTATDGNAYNAFGKRLLWMNETNWQAEQDRKVVDAQYSDPVQKDMSVPTVNLFVNGVYQPAGSGINARNAMLAKPGQNRPTPVGATVPTSPAPNNEASLTNAQYNAFLSRLNKSKGGNGSTTSMAGSSSSVLDLDKLPAEDRKGSTSYGAIAAKLRSVRMPSLAAAAASVALPVSVASTQLPNVAQAADQRHELFTENRPQQVTIGTIEIHIAKADDQGGDEIRRVVQQEILDALNVV